MSAPANQPGRGDDRTSSPIIPADSYAWEMWLSATTHGHPRRVADLIAVGHLLHEGRQVDPGWLAAQLWDLADLLGRRDG